MAALKSPLEMLYHWESTKPNDIYMSQPKDGKWIDYSWKRVGDEVRRMAAYIKSLGYPPGSKIASVSKNEAYWIMTDLAIMMAGHVFVPLYPNLNEKTVKLILEHSEAKMLIVGKLDHWEGMKNGVPADVHMIRTPLWGPEPFESWDDIIKKHEPLTENVVRDPQELASIIYTSGTTGMPKGVMHKMNNFSYAASNALKDIDAKEGSKFFSYLPLSHIAERLLVEMGSLYTGGKVFFAESLDTFAANLGHAKPNIFLAVPRIWDKFQQGILSKQPQKKLDLLLKIPIINGIVKKKVRDGLGLTDANLIFSGAAPISKSLVNWFEKLGINIQEAYAMTENCCYSHASRRDAIKVGTVGQPLSNVDVKISDEGEILIKHEALMDGYYKEPKLSDEAFIDGYLRTGDQGEVDAKGFLKITGRVKDLFKTDKGKYIAPAPIELAISANPYVEQVVLIGMGVPQPIAMIALTEEGKKTDKAVVTESLEETRKEVNPTLDKHENVSTYIVAKDEWSVENGMLTPTMKIKRNSVEKKYLDYFKDWSDNAASIVWES